MDALGWAFVVSVMTFVGWMRFRLYGFDQRRRPARRDVVVVLGVGLLLLATFGAVEAFVVDR